MLVDWVKSSPEFLTWLVLGAFVVWVLTRRKWKTLQAQLAEQTLKAEQLSKTIKAMKNRNKEWLTNACSQPSSPGTGMVCRRLQNRRPMCPPNQCPT